MSRILAIDFGKKRCGVAVSDPLRISTNPLAGIETGKLQDYIYSYENLMEVSIIIIGMPTHADGTETLLATDIKKLKANFEKDLPNIKIHLVDESFSSQQAKSIMYQSGMKKSKRKDKKLIDKMSAVIILRDYLQELI